jgi:ABC-type multidrug transport system fused ATPase/permease subunit
MRGKTTITITHSLSTVQHADTIFVLDHGRLCEQGTHATLLQAGGVYAQLYELQNSRGEVAPNISLRRPDTLRVR